MCILPEINQPSYTVCRLERDFYFNRENSCIIAPSRENYTHCTRCSFDNMAVTQTSLCLSVNNKIFSFQEKHSLE